MARIKIDLYTDPKEAAAALRSLRDVGMNPGDVASAWKVGDLNAGVAVHEVSTAEIGPLQLTGWLAEHALKAAEIATDVELAVVLNAAGLDDREVARVTDALTQGAGVIGVRARDSLGA